ncbi:MAG: hypothetical protein H6872_14880 [Methylobacteriaceae bacterium]|nr:hypothetical protein [Methylobacteriaceae bacterium]
MRHPDGKGSARPILKYSASGVSALCLAVFAGPAIAGGCMSYSPESATISGADGCLSVGRHVRVEAQVMQGSASLGSGFVAGSDDGPRAAALRSESATRLRMGPSAGGVFRR